MIEWYNSQKKRYGNFHKLLQELIEKNNPRRTLTTKKQKLLSKLEAVGVKLKCGESFLPKIYIMTQTLIQKRRVMKSYDELKAKVETIQQQIAEAKKSERTNTLKEAKCLHKEFSFTAEMLKGSIDEGLARK